MNKTLVFFKTHYINSAIVAEYKKLSSSLDDNYDCVLFIDNHNEVVDNPNNERKTSLCFDNLNVNAFLFDKSVHDELNLPYYAEDYLNTDLGKVLWFCGDYQLSIEQRSR